MVTASVCEALHNPLIDDTDRGWIYLRSQLQAFSAMGGMKTDQDAEG